jgi:hypothetical protein
MEQVVSMDEQQMMWFWTLFQSKLVKGAESSCWKLFRRSETI